MTRTALPVLVALAMSACTQTSETGAKNLEKTTPVNTDTSGIVQQITVTSDFETGGVIWESDRITARTPPASYSFAYKAIEIDGKVAICGAGSYSSARDTRASRESMRRSFAMYEGERILSDMRFFTDAGPGTDLLGQKANCVLTETDAAGDLSGVQVLRISRRIVG